MDGPYPYYGPTGQLDAIAGFRLDGTFALIGEDGDHFLEVEKKPQTILVSGKFNVNNHAHVIESTELCSAEWFYNYFRHRSLRPFLTRQGAGRYKLNKAALQEIPIVLPPPGQQEAINALFREWDTAIQKAEQLVAAKERRYGHELWRLIGPSPHSPAQTRTLAGEPPARIREGHPAALGDLLIESREPDTDQDPAKRLTVRLHLKGVEARPVRGTESDAATAYFRRRAGQLIYGKQNVFRGSIGIIPPELDGYASTQDLPAFDIADGIDPQWLYLWLSRRGFYASLEARAAGSGSKRLHPEEFFKIRIFVPEFATQSAIARYLNAQREEIGLLGRFVSTLKTQKRGLMQKLLTGQWRLKPQQAEGDSQ
jgi:type I restriction enzyme S subunit